MKKRIGIVVGIMVMVLAGVMGVMVAEDAEAQTIQEAKEACKGTFTVNQVYSDGTFSSSCIADGPEDGKTYTDNVYNELNGNTEQSPFNGGYGSDSRDTSGSGYGTSSSSGSGGNGASNNSGTGMIGNDDNSDARTKDECGDGQVNTFLFGDCAGGSEGEGVFMVLNVILQVFTWGVGIAGTLGIVLVGIQYITSRDDPAQLTRAKSRMLQIVIGLVAYAVLWAFLQWLLPGGVLGK